MKKLNFIPDEYLSARNIGVENMNPGNIRNIGNFQFQGEREPVDGFRAFISWPYGYRALMKNLQAYINSGTDTLEKIVYKWAPPTDGFNNPESYIKNVSARTGISRTTKINANDINTLAAIAGAMAISEIGTSHPDAIAAAKTLMNTAGATTYTPTPPPATNKSNAIKTGAALFALLTTAYLIYREWK